MLNTDNIRVKINRKLFDKVNGNKTPSWKEEILPILLEAGYKRNFFNGEKGAVYYVEKKPRDNKLLGLKWRITKSN